MTRRSRSSRKFRAAAAALWIAFHAQADNDPGAAVSRPEATSESDKLPHRTTLEALRYDEGVRTRLGAGRGEIPSGQDGSRMVDLAGQERSIQSKDLQSTGMCQWRGAWTSDVPFTSSPICLDEGLGGLGGDGGGGGHTVEERSRTGARGDRGGEEKPPQVSSDENDALHFSHRPTLSRENADGSGQRRTPPDGNLTESERKEASTTLEGHSGLSAVAPRALNSSDLHSALGMEHDPWEGYKIIAQADPVESWEIVRQARLSYYTFKYDHRKGRRQLGVLPTEMAKLLPEAFSTFSLPVQLPDGSRSRVEDVPNIDWTYLFAHTVAVTQELKRRYDALGTKMDILKAETQNASLKLVRFMEEQGKEWQPVASLKELAALSERKRDIAKDKLFFEQAVEGERRRWLELKHNKTLAAAELELELAITLADEKASLAIQNHLEEEKGLEKLNFIEESLRMETDVELLLLDMEAAKQSAKLSSDRRLSEGLAALRETKEAERNGEAADLARIRAKGAEARKQTQAVIDETCAFVGSLVLATIADPIKLARIMALFLGIAFVGLLVGNSVTLIARAIHRRLARPQLVRESDLSGSPPAEAAAWIARHARALLGKWGRRSGWDSSSPEALEGIILPPNEEQRLRVMATSIRSSYDRGAPLPHVLIHGPPGSGKSILARRLSKMCGLYPVVVAGGDVGSLGKNASSELSSLMRWAGGGRRGRGVAVVMDEAEAALGSRRRRGMSENARSALNAMLLHTGELRAGFLLVLTTSRPQDLDDAMLDRVDEVVHLPTPGLTERTRLIRQYFSTYLHHDPPNDFVHAPVAVGQASAVVRTEPAARVKGAKGVVAEGGHCGKSSGSISIYNNSKHSRDLDIHERGDSARGEKQNFFKTRGVQGVQALEEANETTSVAVALLLQPEVRLPPYPNRDKKRNLGGGDGGIRMSDGFREKAPGLMVMLAIRSEGFHGRDMAHFFSAVQAAVFGSEDCELTEALWARTERQKLGEFSEKVLLTKNTSSAATSAAGEVSERNSTTTLLPLPQQHACPTTTTPPTTSTTPTTPYEIRGIGRGQHGRAPPLPFVNKASVCAAAAETNADAAPYCSSTFGNSSNAQAFVTSYMVSWEKGAHERFEDEINYSALAAVPSADNSGTTAASGLVPGSAALEEEQREEEVVEEETERVGWGRTCSPPCDPEVTHPERIID